jgi:predicted amidohydrolase
MRVAAAQMDVKILQKEQNLETILAALENAARNQAKLVVFPECALTGYCFRSLEEALPVVETIPGPATTEIASCAKQLGCEVIVGLLEREGNDIYNSAAVVGPSGILGVHRKVHLPYLGIDRFVARGDTPFPVFELTNCKVGVNICFDCSFPESARVLKLKNAQLLAIPTDWPASSDSWKHTPKVRAAENHMFVVVADRVGEERGFRFAGHSQILDCEGQLLADAGDSEEAILYADFDPAAADNNRIIRITGEYEFDRIAGRRPEMYTLLNQ